MPDLRGLSYPQPVIETKIAVEDPGFTSLAALADTVASAYAIEHLPDHKKIPYAIEVKDDFKVNMAKPQVDIPD